MAVARPRRATQSLREAQKEFTRDKLVRAAAEEFSRGGYVETTIESIIDTAGTSRGTFYLYFDSKAKILIAALETYWLDYAVMDQDFVDLAQRGELSVASLEVLFRRFLKLTGKHRKLLRAWYQAEVLEQAIFKATRDRVANAADFWASLTAAGSASEKEEAALRATLFSALVDRSIYLYMVRENAVTIDRLAPLLAELAYFALSG